jgi:hypothetical protein
LDGIRAEKTLSHGGLDRACNTPLLVGGTGNEHAAGGGFDGDVVRAALAFDIELFNLERLRMPDAGRGAWLLRERQVL